MAQLSYEILPPDRYDEYEDFASSHRYGSFMQSVNWTKVKDNWGHEVLVVRDQDGAIRGGALVLLKKLPLGYTMLYSPRGPVCDYLDKGVMQVLLSGIRELAQKHKGVFFKCDPMVEETDRPVTDTFRALGYQIKEGCAESETVQRRYNYILPDIQGKTPDEVIASFSQKTRYNIRVAKRHNVECRVCGKEGLDDFVMLSRITAERDNFTDRSKEYYAKMLDAFSENMRLYLCYYEGVPLSGAMCCQYAGKTNYIFGASDSKYRNVMPNYLMQWEMIGWALEGGCYIYDFLGIPVNCDPDSPMYGVYRFKKGFNGRAVGYAGEFDYIFRPAMHRLFTMAQEGRRHYYDFRRRLHRLREERNSPKKADKADKQENGGSQQQEGK